MNIYESMLSAIIIIALIHYGAQLFSSHDMMFIKAARDDLQKNIKEMVETIGAKAVEATFEEKEKLLNDGLSEQFKAQEKAINESVDEYMKTWELNIIGQVNKSFENANKAYRAEIEELKATHEQSFTDLYNGLYNDFCARAKTSPHNPMAQDMFVRIFPSLKGRFVSQDTSQSSDKQTATA